MWFKKIVLIIIFVLTVLPYTSSKFYKEILTDFSKCKVHYSWSETTYNNWFEIKNASEDFVFDFHFSILSSSNAHVVLSPLVNPEDDEDVYEIVIGAGNNTFSVIRRKKRQNDMATVDVEGLLSKLDMRSFWIHVFKDGLIEVGKEGTTEPFLEWRDPNPLPVKVFSLATWEGVDAKWYFDCPREDESTTIFQEVKMNFTNLEKLRMDLLTSYDPNVRPVYNYTEPTLVTMSLRIHYISLNERKSTMEIKGEAQLVWKDDKMKWRPNDYGNIEYLHILREEIWEPDIIVFSSITGNKTIFGNSMKIVNNNGMVEWNTPFDLTIWCDAADLGHWPSDNHSCGVVFGFWEDMDNLLLQFRNSDSKIIRKNYNSEWTILELDIISNEGTEELLEDGITAFTPAFLKLTFTLKRISNIYTALFWSSYVVAGICILITFWISPSDHVRIYLCALHILFLSILIIGLMEFLPVHPEKVPFIVLLFSFSLVASFVCTLFTTINANIVRWDQQNIKQPQFIKLLLTSPVVHIFLFQSLQKVSWDIFATFLDRVMFIAYLILFITPFFLKY